MGIVVILEGLTNIMAAENEHGALGIATKIKESLPVLGKLLQHNNREIFADACLALSGDDEKIEIVVKGGVIPRLVQLLHSGDAQVVNPALWALGNITTGTDTQIDAVIQSGALPVFAKLLENPTHPHHTTNASRAISNITAGA